VVNGAPATNPARLVSTDEAVSCLPPPDRYVGRGGHKLAAALEHFQLDVQGRRVADAGSSTGGFTDCVLQAGAAEVIAIDVGRGQLHQRLRDDPRVDVRERLDVRDTAPDLIGGEADLVVADLAFISLTSVLPALLRLARRGADLVILVKPQFEAARRDVDAGGGVITDPEVWRAALERVLNACEASGAAIMGLMTSPLRGADGNVEFLLHLRKPELGRSSYTELSADSIDLTSFLTSTEDHS
jgi:23S rRNA (cytidine1920-2'-O)/16S rRNA (cytidine1409-2'-O)-methyltransferase